MQKAFAGLSAGLIFWAGNAAGQDSLRTYELPNLMVSGHRIETDMSRVARNVTVIDRRQIEEAGYLHLGELLQREAGIFVVGAGQTPGSTQSLFLRGANSNQTAVLINGIRITDPSTPNGVIDLNELSLMDIERVEIVRGSHSSLYGTSGVGGTINLITRQQATPGTGGELRINSGVFGPGASLLQYQGQLRHRTDHGWQIAGNVDHSLVRGLDATIDAIEDPSVFRSNDRDDFRKLDYGLRLGKAIRNGDFELQYRGVRQQADIDAGAFRDDDNAFLRFNRDWLQGRFNYRTGDQHQLSLITGYSMSNRLNVNDSSVVDRNGTTDQSFFRGSYDGTLFTSEIQSVWQTSRTRLVSGVGIYREQMQFDTYFFSDGPWGAFESIVNYDSLSLFANQGYLFSQVTIGNGPLDDYSLGITAGGRLTSHNLAGTILSFELNPHWKPTAYSIVFASISGGFNAPSLYQLYDPSRGFNAFTTRGNLDLTAERSISTEIGGRFTKGKLQYSLSAFQSHVKDAIEYVYLWSNARPIPSLGFSDFRGDTYLNVAQKKIQGIEFGVNGQLLPKLRVNANLSYLNGEFAFNPEDIPAEIRASHHIQLYNNGAFLDSELTDSNLIRRPNLMANLQAFYRLNRGWEAGTFMRYVGARPDIAYDGSLGPFGALAASQVEAFSTLDIMLSKQLSNKSRAMLRIENLSNNLYSEINGFATRGRSFYLQLNFNW